MIANLLLAQDANQLIDSQDAAADSLEGHDAGNDFSRLMDEAKQPAETSPANQNQLKDPSALAELNIDDRTHLQAELVQPTPSEEGEGWDMQMQSLLNQYSSQVEPETETDSVLSDEEGELAEELVSYNSDTDPSLNATLSLLPTSSEPVVEHTNALPVTDTTEVKPQPESSLAGVDVDNLNHMLAVGSAPQRETLMDKRLQGELSKAADAAVAQLDSAGELSGWHANMLTQSQSQQELGKDSGLPVEESELELTHTEQISSAEGDNSLAAAVQTEVPAQGLGEQSPVQGEEEPSAIDNPVAQQVTEAEADNQLKDATATSAQALPDASAERDATLAAVQSSGEAKAAQTEPASMASEVKPLSDAATGTDAARTAMQPNTETKSTPESASVAAEVKPSSDMDSAAGAARVAMQPHTEMKSTHTESAPVTSEVKPLSGAATGTDAAQAAMQPSGEAQSVQAESVLTTSGPIERLQGGERQVGGAQSRPAPLQAMNADAASGLQSDLNAETASDDSEQPMQDDSETSGKTLDFAQAMKREQAAEAEPKSATKAAVAAGQQTNLGTTEHQTSDTATVSRSLNELQSVQHPQSQRPMAQATPLEQIREQVQQKLELQQEKFAPALGQRLMMMVNNKMQTAEIKLDPPELGSMMVRIQVQNDQAHLHVVAQQPHTRDMLEQALPRLRELMQEQGLQLADAQVGRQDRQASGQGGEQAQAERGGTAGHNASDGESMLTTQEQSEARYFETRQGVDFYA